MKKIFFIIAMFFSLFVFSQNVIMHTGTVSQCGGIFYDSGGAGGTYQASENYTLTICAGMPGSQVTLNFTQFAVENNFEHLAIYEGTGTGGIMLVNATGTVLQGQTITSQGSGCLTLVFTSDGSVNQTGWAAAIGCTFPCQAFDVNITGANVPYFNGDTIHVCQGQPITFNAAGIYPNNNVNYPQSDATTVFTWDFGDGSPLQTGAGLSTVTHTFPNGGGYFTSVSGTDISSCDNSNYARNMVMVSTTPYFTGTNLSPDTICLGQTVNLNGTMVTTNTWTQPVPNVVSGLTFLPDGSGASYSTSITHTMFGPGQTLTNVNQLQSLCMNIEHSFLGDLEVWLTCPNGQSVNLIGYYNYTCTTCALPYPGYPQYPGATHLGEPCDVTPATSPGIGYDYCWNPSATGTLPGAANVSTHTFTDQEGNAVTGTYIPVGNYAPETPFSNFIGCPLNGDWTIHVTDHLGADDGYIFYWMLNFDPSIIPPLWSFSNTYNPSDHIWTGNGVGSQANGIGTAVPTTTGNVVYTYTVTDDFGCPYDTTLSVFVEAAGSPNCCVAPVTNAGLDGSSCLLTYSLQAVPNIGTGTWSQISGPGTSSFSNANLATATVTVTTAGTYTFQWFENNGTNCTNFDQVDITFTAQPVANAGIDGQTCSLSFTMAATPSVGTGTWTQVSGPGTSTFVTQGSAATVVNVTAQGSYTYSWTENNSGCTNSDNVVINYAVQPVANAGADNSVCQLTYQLQALPSVGVGTWTYTGTGIATFVNANNANTNVTVTLGGAYNFTWTENNGLGCVSSDIVVITFTQQPVANAGINISVCQLSTALQGVASVGTGTWTQQSGPGTITFTPATSPTATATASLQGVYSLLWTEDNGNGCTSSDNMTATFTTQPVANAGLDDQICSQTINLAAMPSVGTGTWFNLPGPGSVFFTNSGSPNSSVTVSQYGTYNFIWNENNGNGCNDQDTVKIIFDYIPTSTFDLGIINCFGDNATVTYTGDGVSGATYTWNFGPATIASGTGQGPYQINFATAAIFPISLEVSQNGCTSAITSLNITNPPALTLSLSKIDVTCFGLDNGMVSTTVGGGSLPYSYLWSTGSVFSMIPSASAGTYVLTVTDVNGCTKVDQKTVLEPPQLAIDVPDYIPICNDSILTITASATGGVFPYTLLWNTGQNSNMITVSPDTTTHYFVMATDANFCTSLTNIEVFVYPVLKLAATQSADSICLGETVILTPTASGGKGEPYNYFINGSPTITPIILYPNTAQSYQVMVKDGCNYTAQVDMPVFVYPSPNLSPSTDKIEGCTPLSVQFNESTPDEGQTYIWNFGDNQAAFTKNPMHIFKQPGTYTIGIIVTNIYGCKAEDPSLFTIESYPVPEAQFEPTPAVASVIKPIITFNNYSTLAESVKWYFGDSDSSNAYNPTHFYPAYPPGIYDVTLIVMSNKQCSDTIMGKIEIKDEFTFYAPSAFSPDNDGKNDEFFVFGSNINPETFTLMVYDRWGEVIFKTNDMHEGWKGYVKGGEKAPIGNYSWICTFRDFKRILHEKTGSVTVIR